MKKIVAIPEDKPISFPIAIVVSRFNHEITKAAEEGALEQLAYYGFNSEDITLVEVPGAVEIPLVAKLLAQSKRYEAIICLGAVIRGETSHYDYVCDQVSQGCQQVMMEYQLPVLFGILTTENEAQAWDRLGGKHGHKGKDCVDAALAMRALIKDLSH